MIRVYVMFLLIYATRSQPNIIFIMGDDLGYGDLGYTGNIHHQTPNIDMLASRGVFFTDYYAGASVCTPSRGSTLTGKYFSKLGLYPGVLDPYDIGGLNMLHHTYVRRLREAGYSTALVGKWHLGIHATYHPFNHGFQHYYGIPFSHDECTSKIHWNGAASGIYGPCPLFEGCNIAIQRNFSMITVDDLYLSKVKEHIAALREPYYIHVTPYHTHLPYYPLNSVKSSVEALDKFVGHIVGSIGNNTIVIFTSDNGAPYWFSGSNNDPYRCAKGSTWEGDGTSPL